MCIPLPKSMIAASFVALCSSCAPHGGHSDDCGPIISQPVITLTKLNSQATSNVLNLPIQRANGSNIVVTIEFSIVRGQDWCRREYQGPLTLSLQNLPSSISKSFDPAIIPTNLNQGVPQVSNLSLTIPSSVPDGYIPISINAKEFSIIVKEYNLVLQTI